jgi:hypothetical protein
LEARVGLSVQVRRGSAAEVAQNGLTSVRAAVLPKVQRAVAATQSELDVREDGDRDDPAAFQRLRAQTTEVLWQQLERQLDYLPTWLNAEISSVVVELDAAAGAHTTALVSTEHDGRQAAARTASKLGAMDEVAERLLPRLSDPHQRIFIKALMDPSADNIDEAIALAAQAENETAGYMLQLVHRLLDGDYIDKSDPVYASLVAVVDGSLQQLGRATHLTALGTGEQAGEPRAPREHGDAQTVEGEIVQEAGDTDFTDGGANDDREAS